MGRNVFLASLLWKYYLQGDTLIISPQHISSLSVLPPQTAGALENISICKKIKKNPTPATLKLNSSQGYLLVVLFPYTDVS